LCWFTAERRKAPIEKIRLDSAAGSAAEKRGKRRRRLPLLWIL
jgi:hypothetical protein